MGNKCINQVSVVYNDNSRIETLSSDELNLIKLSWKAINVKNNLGIQIMISLFQTNNAKIKQLWVFAANLETEDEMLQNSQLRYHGEKIVSTFDKVINILTSPSNEQIDLIALGRRHHGYGLRKEYFIYFENACISSLEKNINNNQIFDINSQLAWRNFIKFILDRYLDGLIIEEC